MRAVYAAILVLGAMLSGGVGPLQAADPAAGKAKSGPCTTCHGKSGIGTSPIFPNLAGQKSMYLVQQLQAFRKGTRQSQVMNIVVKTLSDQDIENLAAYYEGLPPGGSAQ